MVFALLYLVNYNASKLIPHDQISGQFRIFTFTLTEKYVNSSQEKVPNMFLYS